MNEIIFDTHAVVWLLKDDRQLGPQSRFMALHPAEEDVVLVSSFTFWEVAMLHRHNRPIIPITPREFRHEVTESGILEIPVSTEIAILSQELDRGFPADPADRIIVATAISQRATLVTADAAILQWPGELRRHDARS